jgi:sporulation protein YlmC with PRC-barrel domain
MRSRLIIAASVLGLLAGPALAQSSSSSAPPAGSAPGGLTRTSPTTPPGAAATAPAPIPAPDPLTMEDTADIKGSAVYGSDNKKIGSVSAVLMQPTSKTIDRLVVNEGGLLGVGGHRVALPVSDFKWNGDKDAFVIGKTADELKAMPEWKAASAGSVSSPIAPSSGSSSSGSSTRPPLSTAPAGSLAAPSNAGTSGGSTSE